MVLTLGYVALVSTNYNYNTVFKGILCVNVLYSLSLVSFLFNNIIFSKNIGYTFSVENIASTTNPFPLCLYVDYISVNMGLLTSLLTTILIAYSYFYMKKDVHTFSFIQLVQFFSVSMLFFLVAGDIFTLFLGWELVGLSSFFLINFWSNKVSSLKAALKAFFFNKLSDFFFLIFVVIFLSEGGFSLCSIFRGTSSLYFGPNSNVALTSLLLCSFFKSVQFGFHVWLPDSMEAPIPASALIHSATLVSAGLYLALRFIHHINICVGNMYVLSVFTAFYGSVCAFFQTDLKKILAYSTISHCGYMFLPVFFEQKGVFIIYFYTHGFAKAFCFLLVGMVIQDISPYQDSRKISPAFGQNSFEYYVLPIIIFSLGGLPFFFGLLSKLVLVEVLLKSDVHSSCFFFLDISSAMALFYCMNLVSVIFYKKSTRVISFVGNCSHQTPNPLYLGILLVSYLCMAALLYYCFSPNFLLLGAFRGPVTAWVFYLYKFLPIIFFCRVSSDFYKDLPAFFIFAYVFL